MPISGTVGSDLHSFLGLAAVGSAAEDDRELRCTARCRRLFIMRTKVNGDQRATKPLPDLGVVRNLTPNVGDQRVAVGALRVANVEDDFPTAALGVFLDACRIEPVPVPGRVCGGVLEIRRNRLRMRLGVNE